jgi:hypothetical protein
VRMRITKAGFIVGVGGGTGVLHFKGHTYRLRIDGISAGTIGVASADLAGTASNLRTAADIAGTYTPAGSRLRAAISRPGCRMREASYWTCRDRRSVLSSRSASVARPSVCSNGQSVVVPCLSPPAGPMAAGGTAPERCGCPGQGTAFSVMPADRRWIDLGPRCFV